MFGVNKSSDESSAPPERKQCLSQFLVQQQRTRPQLSVKSQSVVVYLRKQNMNACPFSFPVFQCFNFNFKEIVAQ